MEHAHKHLSQSYVIRRDLVQMERVQCVVSGGVKCVVSGGGGAVVNFVYFRILLF
jgi:hypothetical protein